MEDLLSKSYVLPLHLHRTLHLLDPPLSTEAERKMCVRRNFTSSTHPLPWAPPPLLLMFYTQWLRLHIERDVEKHMHPRPYILLHSRSRILSNLLETFPLFLPCRVHIHMGYIQPLFNIYFFFFFAVKAQRRMLFLRLWLWHSVECLLMTCMKNASTDTELFSLQFGGPFSCALKYLPCARANWMENLAKSVAGCCSWQQLVWKL